MGERLVPNAVGAGPSAGASAAPQWLQKRAVSAFSPWHLAQRIRERYSTPEPMDTFVAPH